VRAAKRLSQRKIKVESKTITVNLAYIEKKNSVKKRKIIKQFPTFRSYCKRRQEKERSA
jgi:hypothetical protein